MANNERRVDLAIGAKDQFSATLSKLDKAQQRIQKQNEALARGPQVVRDNFYTKQATEIEKLEARIRELRARFVDLSAAEGDNRKAIAGVVTEKIKLQDQAIKLRARLDDVREATQRLSADNRGSFQAFSANARAMEQEAASARNLERALAAANSRLRDNINARLNSPVRSNFGQFVQRETISNSSSDDRAEIRAIAVAQRKAEIQERLNNKARSGFNDWQRYLEAVERVAAAEQRSAAAAERTRAVFALKETIQERLNQKTSSGFLAFSRAADGLQLEAAAAANTATQLRKVEQASDRAAQSQRKLASASKRVSNVRRRTGRDDSGGRRTGRDDSGGRRGEDQDVELYGLRPYQMVNLGYQVNDVISGLAMGQAPLQVLAQQAGQFAQIWPEVMVGLVRGLPIIAGVGAAFTPFVAALIRVRTEANTLKELTRELALLADGGRYSAEGLGEIVEALDRVGVSVQDARDGVMALVKDGFNATQIQSIANMARELSKVTGQSFPDEVKRLGDAFSGNVGSIRELDKELQFLTAEQLRQILTLERQGLTAGAAALAQEFLAEKLRNTKEELTPLAQAMKDLGSAWNTVVEAIANSTLFQDFLRDLSGLARDIETITKGLQSAATFVSKSLGTNPTQQDTQDRRIEELLRERAGIENFDSGFGMSDEKRERLAEIDEEIAAIKELATERARAAQQEAATNAATAATRSVIVEKTEEQKKIETEIQFGLETRLEAMARETELATATAKEQFVQQQILEAQNEAKEKGIKLGETQLQQIRDQAGLLFEAQSSALATGNFGSLVDRIIGIESGGRADAKNPNSSATGAGQFIESTWLNLFRKYFPEAAQNMGREAILELRKDAAVSRNLVEIYARENAKVLQSAGVAVNDAAVYLAHFLGPGGATKLLQAAPGTQTRDILGADQISANRSILENKTAAEVVAWAERKVGLTDQQVAGQTRLNELQTEEAKRQADYNKGYQDRISAQQFELELASKSLRDAAVAKALRDEELKAREAGRKLTAEQRAEIEKTTGALFDQQNAMTRVNELLAQRSLLAESLQIAQDAGDSGQVEKVVEQIRLTEDELVKAIDSAIAFYTALGGPEADAAIAKLQNLKATVGDVLKDFGTQFLPQAEEINESLADIGSDAFSAFAEAIAKGQSAAGALFAALRQGIAEFLIDIGKAIVKQALFNAISGGSAGGGVGGGIAGLVGGLFGVRHSGGLVGAAANTRRVDPMFFANAQYHHSGGLVGRERPIIALEDEEVLTRNDPRHILNGGGGQDESRTKIVNVLSGADVMQHALADEVGQKVFFNFVTNNRSTFSAALGLS